MSVVFPVLEDADNIACHAVPDLPTLEFIHLLQYCLVMIEVLLKRVWLCIDKIAGQSLDEFRSYSSH